MSLGERIDALAQALGGALGDLIAKVDRLGNAPFSGSLDWAAYTENLSQQGSTLIAPAGVSPPIAFGLLNAKIPSGEEGFVEVDFSQGCILTIKPSSALGEGKDSDRLRFIANNFNYIGFDRGNWVNPPFNWQAGDRLRFRRMGGQILVELKPLNSNWGVIYTFDNYPLTSDIYFHPSFYIENPITEARLSNPYGYKVVKIY